MENNAGNDAKKYQQAFLVPLLGMESILHFW
jgi:hypothetical protein